MNKTVKIITCVAGGALVAIGSLILADRYLGKNYLGSPTGKIIGRCCKDDKFYLYVKRFNRINEVEVDRNTYMLVSKGDYFDMSSEGVKPLSRRRAKREDVENTVSAEELNDLVEDIAEEPICDCVGPCSCDQPQEE